MSNRLIQNAVSKYQTANEQSSKTKQVVMLYEGILRFLNNAKSAIREKNIQDRFNSLEKAVEIINGLQLCLDQENGGEVATELNKFYNTMVTRINLINIKHEGEEAVELIVQQFKPLKEAWEEVDKQYNAGQITLEVAQKAQDANPDQGVEISI
ncbi:MAG: fliS [Rickettsiaceae bacterium]|jgi:flagellar protein FliS|nr:fliS [Rickettsiaceae bacterium]